MLWLLRRLATSALLMWVVATVVFLALHMVPGDPAEILLSTGGAAPDAFAVAELREKLGLNLPILEQYRAFLERLARFDLGTSLVDEYPVADEILLRLPRTLELIAAGTLLGVAVALPAGTYAAVHAGGAFDRASSAVAAVVQAVPVFVLGTLLILVLAQWLRWMPAGGYVPLAQDPGRHFLLLLLPAVAVAKGLAATVFRMARASVLDQLTRDHVRTARAKGLTEPAVLLCHVLPNAMIPILTSAGSYLPYVFLGSLLFESFFGIPGLGAYVVDAIASQDFAVVRAMVFLGSLLYVAAFLLIDIAYTWVDPRVRLE